MHQKLPRDSERLFFLSLKDSYLMNCTDFFSENDLLSFNQSGFAPGDSCINQLFSITHEIYQSFDNDLEMRGVFLDLSKGFDKVSHEGLILKLSNNGIYLETCWIF